MEHFLDGETHYIKNLRSAANALRQPPFGRHPSGPVTPIYAANCDFCFEMKCIYLNCQVSILKQLQKNGENWVVSLQKNSWT